MEGNFKEIKEKLWNNVKKKVRVEKIFRKFYIKFGDSLWKTCGISKLILRTFESTNFRITKSRPSKNQRWIFWKNFEKNLINFYKKIEEQSQKTLINWLGKCWDVMKL